MRQRSTYFRLAPVAVAVGLALFGFSAMFGRLRAVFADDLEDMSHGWLVPLFSLYVLWTERKRIRESLGAPSWAGFAAAVPCLALALLGSRGLQLRFEQLGFIGLAIALPWAFFGRETAKRFVFPALFLLFTVPLATFLDVVTIHLRLLASGTAFAVLRGLGVDAVQHGTAIVSEGAHAFSIDVAEPCSGLRSLFALAALTAAYAWQSQPTWGRRAVLFACALPLAVLGNVARILSICLVAAWANPRFATGFYHDYSGYIVFLVAIVLMVAIGELITRLCGEAPNVAEDTPDKGDAWGNGCCGRRWAMTVLLAPVFLFQASAPEPVVAEAPSLEWPAELPGYRAEDVRYCQEERCAAMMPVSRLPSPDAPCPLCGGKMDSAALGENTVLPPDTIIRKKMYLAPGGRQFLISAVIGGRTKSSIHRPELCIPAQGLRMSEPSDFEVAGRPFHAIRIDGPHSAPQLLAYTFFNQAGMRTASHVRRIFVDVWDRSVMNRVDRWVMVTVHASSPDGFVLSKIGDRTALRAFLSAIAAALDGGKEGG